MATDPDAQDQPRRPRLFVPGAAASPSRPKIVLPGHGLIDPDATPAEDIPPVIEEEMMVPAAAEEFVLPEEETGEALLPLVENPDDFPAEAEVFFDSPPLEVSTDDEAVEAELPQDTPAAEEFLGQVEPAPIPRARPPELRAAPASLKNLAPRTLGPPAGWQIPSEPEPAADDTGMMAPSADSGDAADSSSVPAWQPAMAETPAEEEAPEYDPATAEAVWPENPPAEDEQATETWVGEAPEEPVATPAEPLPVLPLRVTSSVRVPTPLTSPHSTRPLSRGSTQRVRTPTGTTTAQHIHAAHGTHAGHATHAGAAPKVAIPPPPQRMIPGWMLVLMGVLFGALAGIFGVAKSPMQEKLGLIPQAEANKFALTLLKEERLQVQTMLSEYHRNSKINLASDMEEFRAEQGRKAPERMTMAEFITNTKEDAEEEKRIKEEEAKEDAAAAEADKAAAEKPDAGPN